MKLQLHRFQEYSLTHHSSLINGYCWIRIEWIGEWWKFSLFLFCITSRFQMFLSYLLVILSKLSCAAPGHPTVYLLPNSNKVDSKPSCLKNITRDEIKLRKLQHAKGELKPLFISDLTVRESHCTLLLKRVCTLSRFPQYQHTTVLLVPASPQQNPLWHFLYLSPASKVKNMLI